VTLITRCANCGTAFRLLPAQLAARGGRVRCGKCGQVFDGVAGLVEPAHAAPEHEPSPQLALFEAARRAAATASIPPGTSLSAAAAAGEPELLPEFMVEDEEPAPPRHRLLWGLGAALLAVLLAAQALLHFRTEIAVLVPEARAPLAQACARLGCELRLPRRPELMSIETSDLQTDNRREGVIVLNAVIRNRAPFPQEYPSLELTLTDERDEALVRRVLAPGEYLHAGLAERAAQGIAPGTEAVLRMSFDASRVKAIGYRLYLFYP
jgi:predicted Zn finger-like uncharacterized protein